MLSPHQDRRDSSAHGLNSKSSAMNDRSLLAVTPGSTAVTATCGLVMPSTSFTETFGEAYIEDKERGK